MSIPSETTVLVIGGGPGGSYAASALAREGIDTVVLEADIFPRYHVGESMIPSMRPFLRFIDLDDTFLKYGFVKKTGAAFKLNRQKDAYTDFILEPGADSHAWNVIRSESDELIFRHAGKCGSKIFDGVKVTGIDFIATENPSPQSDGSAIDPGRPVSASWTAKDGRCGSIKFDYLIDASGRAGMVSTKYMKNRSYNKDLKNVASWGYWRGAISYGIGTPKEGQPLFEALNDTDGSGWVWFIPLHDKTVSVGVVMNQEASSRKKRESSSSNSREFYLESINDASGVTHLLKNATLESDIKHASDWSYSASEYGNRYLRIVGDAGAFIDPYFSSGVHLALAGALSAAVSICASIRKDCDEETAWKWHSNAVRERFTRFLLIVMTVTKQIRAQEVPILNSENEDGFDGAFHIIRPVIQGLSDVNGKATHNDVSHAVEFSAEALAKSKADVELDSKLYTDSIEKEALTHEEQRMLRMVKHVFRDFFAANIYDGLRANLVRGNLGLEKIGTKSVSPDERFVDTAVEAAQVAA
ncbi:radH flavin-dependent halogenase [Talaromyces proteolyticus]|uniref:RadH flavin-dependent halogenase n=1 Tax=Talaromyces proteolyticus TaxID=1131652 RepID=A0AAD4KH81_9EURO|nr:radH flavin-dependent halogenase [Talaromyces proteolyticus]KAH8691645.1 radH flavin-dependent halogenase [Talaromyces proteolyticus]